MNYLLKIEDPAHASLIIEVLNEQQVVYNKNETGELTEILVQYEDPMVFYLLGCGVAGKFLQQNKRVSS